MTLDNLPSIVGLTKIKELSKIAHHPIKLVWIGLDHAGKSTLIKRLRTGEFISNLPRTMGLTVDKFFYEADSSFELVSWDLGGQVFFREHLWNDYLKNASAIIYVIDATENVKERLEESKVELWKYVLENINNLTNIPLLILASKSDLEGSKSAEEISSLLELSKVKKENIEIFNVSAHTGFQLAEAFEWLFEELLKLTKKTPKESKTSPKKK